MSPVTLAPQSDLLPHLQAEGLDRGPPGLQQLLGGGSVPQASGAPVGHGAAGVGLGVPHFGSAARGFDGHGAPHRPESTTPQRSTHDASGGSGGNLVGYTGGVAGASVNVNGGVDLHVPLSEHTQNMLFKQVPALLELPKFIANDNGISKAERVREWKCAVNDKLAALAPLFKEYWRWSWAV